MTNEEILAITEPSRELDLESAHIVGWDGKHPAVGFYRPNGDYYCVWLRDWVPSNDTEQGNWQTRLLQERIKELGLETDYIYQLAGCVLGEEPGIPIRMSGWFKVINASALDRTKAAILARRK